MLSLNVTNTKCVFGGEKIITLLKFLHFYIKKTFQCLNISPDNQLFADIKIKAIC